MVPVVRSTFRLLEELSKNGALGLNDLTQRTGISKSTVFRILTTLTHLGYVVRDPSRTYYVSQTIGDLVSMGAGVEAIRRAALPRMLQLRDQYGETVNLGHLELDKVTYIEVVPSEYALRLHERPAATVCLHASALGKAILAFSDEEFASSLLRGRELPKFTRNTIVDSQELLAELRRNVHRGKLRCRSDSRCVGKGSRGHQHLGSNVALQSAEERPCRRESPEDGRRHLAPTAASPARQREQKLRRCQLLVFVLELI